MRELERRFPNELVIIGVHSGKYTAERVTERIREAALRLGNTHPIVNDRQFRVWRSYAVRAWPTVAAVDPTGHVLGGHAGEFTADMLVPFLERTIAAAEAGGTLDRRPLHFAPDRGAATPGTLRYPGKIALDGRRIAIADTGHHRVIVGTLDPTGRRMHVERTLGGDAGYADGDDPRFDAPQGLTFAGPHLYVCDAGSHTVRVVDLITGGVRTLAGTGSQLRTAEDMRAGALSSPWDLTLVGDTLYVAMAGVHRLWAIDVRTGTQRGHAGSGAEDIGDGPLGEATLAQPMGIVHAAHGPETGGRLYFVDAESSAVRWASVDPGGSVGTVVGTGLFDFGDADGVGDDVRMQHQQALVLHPGGRLLVADSYNDALKWVNPVTREATTWIRGLHEPAGLALGGDLVYVADTNAHRIAIVDQTGAIGALEIE